MSSFRGASGANKSRLHNVNSVYSGKNTAATKASGPGKHGLQPLGKATAVVRRMPPPATLPSLKAEHGQDPSIAIVPQGGTGWTKSSTETESNKQNGSTDITGGNAPDLRPTWAKPTNTSTTQASSESSATNASSTMTNYPSNSQQSQGTAAQVVQGTAAAPPNNRDFPSLAASVAAVSGSKSDTGSLKPQKTCAWGTNLADANVEIPPIPYASSQQNQSGGYIGASTAPKPHVERKLPERYFSSQPPVTQSRVAAKIGIREKLARLSMESKEPSIDAEMKAASEAVAEPVKTAMETPITESPKEAPVAQQQQPPTLTAPMNQQQFSQPPPPIRSQDVRQLQPSQFPVPEHQPQQDWQSQERYASNGAPYNYEQQQKLLQNGRGEGGYGGPPRAMQQQHGYQGGGFVGQQRFDERGNPYGERQIEELGWGDELSNNDNRRGMVNQNRNTNRYRIDSRSSTEAENTWQGPPPQHYGQQQAGPRPPMPPPQNAGWYDNSGYPLVPPGQDYNTAQYPPGNNYNQRSRNSSVATEYNNYEQQQKGPRHTEGNNYRQGYQNYSGGNNYHEVSQQHSHDNQQHQQQRNIPPNNRQLPPQQHQQQQQQRFQQPEMPYRMLKRNDEKSAEYIAHHGGGPIIQQQQQSAVEEEPKTKSKESKPRSQKSESEKSQETKAAISQSPKENIWEKRMEERKKEERSKPNSRYQQELDFNFPSINDVPKDSNEWNPLPPPTASSDSSSKTSNSRKGGQRRNDANGQQYQQPKDQQQQQRPRNAEDGPVDVESIGATHWVQHNNGPSWDDFSIPADHRVEEPFEEDNVYTGTKREFVNSKRSRGSHTKAGDFGSRDIRQQKRGDSTTNSGAVNGRKISSQKPGFDPSTKRPSRSEDNFSSMGVFNAEDYKLPEESSSSSTRKPHRQRDTFENIESFEGPRRGSSKRGVLRQPRGNNNWKGSERPKNSEIPHEGGNEKSFDRHDITAANSRGNGRRLAPMGGRGSSSRFLSKHTNKPTRHKHIEGSIVSSARSSNRASADRNNVEGLKSPAASEGVDEWETASESSDVGGREEQQPQPQNQENEAKPLTNGVRNPTKHQNSSDTTSTSLNPKDNSQGNVDEKFSSSKTSSSTTTTRSHQKNVKPASHTYLGNGVSAKSSNAYNNKNNSSSNGNNHPLQLNNKHRMHNQADNAAKAEQHQQNKEIARDNRKTFGSHNGNSNLPSVHMGLAGVDINDASVIIIDNQPDILRDESYSEAGDFEEVLSKKQKKQRLLQIEEERRKEQKEKEKAEKIQARKAKALQKRTEKVTRKSQEKTTTAKEASPATEPKKTKPTTVTQSTASPLPKPIEHDLGTSVWNNSLLASSPTMVEKIQQPHIPSPIARPTKPHASSLTTTTTSTSIPTPPSSLTIDVNAVKENFEAFTIATSTVTTATTSACYDFAYDTKLKAASPVGAKPSPKPALQEKKPSSDSTLLELNSDHVQLKEKLDKVKDFWPGQQEFDQSLENGHINKTSLSQAHGPNVAKVKPQPQHHDQQHQQQQQQIPPFTAPEVKTKPIETFNAFAIPPSQSPNLYHRGNAVFATMGPTSPFRQISSNQIYSMPYGNNDYIQHYGGHHPSSPPNQSFFGGQIAMTQQPQQHQQPSRPQSFDGMFNTNQLWNNGIDILSTITSPLQTNNQARYVTNSRPPSHPSTNVAMPNGFPPTHLPPPPSHMGYQQQHQQPLQQVHQPSNNSYIPTHIPPPTIPHTFIELMNGPPPPPIGAPPRNVNNNNIPRQNLQHQNNYRPQMQILRPQQFSYNATNGVPILPPQLQQHQHTSVANVAVLNHENQNNSQRIQIHQQQQNWQKHPQEHQQHHQRHPQQQQIQTNGHHPTSNYGGYFNNIKYSTNQPTA